MRDFGIPNERILIANREDAYAEDAKSKGFIVEHDFVKAAAVADSEHRNILTQLRKSIDDIRLVVLFLLIPDQVQPRVFNEQFSPSMKEGATIVIASGYNVFFKLLQFKPQQDVVMVAPRLAGLFLTDPSPYFFFKDDRKLCSFVVPERKGLPLLCFRRARWIWIWFGHDSCTFTGDWGHQSWCDCLFC